MWKGLVRVERPAEGELSRLLHPVRDLDPTFMKSQISETEAKVRDLVLPRLRQQAISNPEQVKVDDLVKMALVKASPSGQVFVEGRRRI